MKLYLATLLVIVCISGVFGQSATDSSDAATQKELGALIQKLMDAIPVGDRATWEKYVADDVIYTDENFKVLSKKDLLDSLKPLPKGCSGSIKAENFQFRIKGDAAIVVWESHEEEFVFGQRLAPLYLVTDTYFKRNGQWQLVAEQIIVRPSERPPVKIDAKNYQSLVGEYKLTPGVIYKAMVEDGKLMIQRTGRNKQELLPADVNTYSVKGTIRGEMIFIRDAQGEVVEIRDRRENNDLVWKKIK